MGKNIEDQMEIVLKPASVRRLETFDEAIIHTRFKTVIDSPYYASTSRTAKKLGLKFSFCEKIVTTV